MSDRDTRFLSHFWQSLQASLESKLKFSSAYHPQTDGQSERTIQVLEDMLQAYIMDFKRSWEDHLYLVEFSYNKSYHASVYMAPFEAYMAESADRQCAGMILGKESYLGQN